MEQEKKVIRTERGWPGHFCAANHCRFRRNTLLEYGEIRIVVSTVGLMEHWDLQGVQEICPGRCFETVAFHAQHDGRYWDADISRRVRFSSPWSIKDFDADDQADDMHEAVVAEITERLLEGEEFKSEEDYGQLTCY